MIPLTRRSDGLAEPSQPSQSRLPPTRKRSSTAFLQPAFSVHLFPGHGHSRGDSHYELPDITSSRSEVELQPYERLISDGKAKIIMGGHLRLASIEKEPVPTTLSNTVTHGLLRERLGFRGVIMTDSLDMDAVLGTLTRRDAVIRAVSAGNDILMIKNVGLFDPCLPQNVLAWVRDAIKEGVLRERDIADAAERVRKIKQEIAVKRPNIT
jgi:beta-N-acetylhexosaminidase